ncbi:hypothetical protein EJ07DRAFT_136819 [Lizonia empirigonia]|nr:hypothetical protein EJ07DRAFT_136819 [Lizonia empirigonia]
MSELDNNVESFTSNTSNITTGSQATNPPANNPIASSTRPNPSTSCIGTHPVNRRPLNRNDQAQRTTPTDSNIYSDHQARDNALNNQNDTPPSAVRTVEYTDNPTVRELYEAFHTDAPQRPRGPSTRASSIAHQMTARDRQELGLQPDPSQSERTSNNNQSTTSEPNSFDFFATPSPGIPPVAVTDTPVTLSVSRDDYFSLSDALQSNPPQTNSSGSLRVSQAAEFTAFGFHASELPSYAMRLSAPPSGTAALSSHPIGEASDTANIFNITPLVNERSGNSSVRSSYDLTALDLRGEPVLDIGDLPDSHPNTASGNPNTTHGIHASANSEIDCNNGQAEHSNRGVIRNSNGRAQANPNPPMDDALSVNVSDLRLGPASRETLAGLALFSQYPEDNLNTAAPDEDSGVA